MFARNILIFVPREQILGILNHILQWQRAKTKYKHMVDYRGVKLFEATCSPGGGLPYETDGDARRKF